MVRNLVTDPYSTALTADSTHSLAVDLADPKLAPPGWKDLRKPAPVPFTSAQIQELHIRDFSVADRTSRHPGQYLAFTDSDSAGMRHLRDLAAAGTSYVHLLPAFDIGTIPEKAADRTEPACDLKVYAPDSDAQQACVAAAAAKDAYNWGYDPLHYTVPEGSYASDPDGTARTVEFRRMVQSLNGSGLRTVMDVVYNHTVAAGQNDKSVLDRIVPGYYQRLLADGSVATSTCCANTAPENAMMGRLVVDSVVTWAKQYKVDGFRFDLMGHHPKANILAVRAALDALTPAKDGVDGKKIVLYGEGWNFGEIADDARFVQATQKNMAGTGIATFSDRARDAVRGGGPFDEDPRVQGFASGLFTEPNGSPANGTPAEQRARLLHAQDLIKVGLSGNLAPYAFTDSAGRPTKGSEVDYNGAPAGYAAAPGDALAYADAHDNETLADALTYKLPAATAAADRARMQVLAMATAALSQGPALSQAGTDLLRSKSLDRNSYDSGDWFNALHWDCREGNGFGRGLPPAADNASKWTYAKPLLTGPAPGCPEINGASAAYRDLLRIRTTEPSFALTTAEAVQRQLAFPLSGTDETPGVITMTLGDLVVVFNATPTAQPQRLAALAGTAYALHPVQAAGSDATVRQAAYDARTGSSPPRPAPSPSSHGGEPVEPLLQQDHPVDPAVLPHLVGELPGHPVARALVVREQPGVGGDAVQPRPLPPGPRDPPLGVFEHAAPGSGGRGLAFHHQPVHVARHGRLDAPGLLVGPPQLVRPDQPPVGVPGEPHLPVAHPRAEVVGVLVTGLPLVDPVGPHPLGRPVVQGDQGAGVLLLGLPEQDPVVNDHADIIATRKIIADRARSARARPAAPPVPRTARRPARPPGSARGSPPSPRRRRRSPRPAPRNRAPAATPARRAGSGARPARSARWTRRATPRTAPRVRGGPAGPRHRCPGG